VELEQVEEKKALPDASKVGYDLHKAVVLLLDQLVKV
jgi:hypothetical protein